MANLKIVLACDVIQFKIGVMEYVMDGTGSMILVSRDNLGFEYS